MYESRSAYRVEIAVRLRRNQDFTEIMTAHSPSNPIWTDSPRPGELSPGRTFSGNTAVRILSRLGGQRRTFIRGLRTTGFSSRLVGLLFSSTFIAFLMSGTLRTASVLPPAAPVVQYR